MKKLLALLLTLVLALTVLAGCGQEEPAPIHSIPYDITAIPPEETAAVIDGREIPAQHYFYWLGYSCGNLEYQIHMLNSYYGIYSELFLEDGSIDWSASLEDGQTLSQLAKDRAASTVSYYAAIDALAEELGIPANLLTSLYFSCMEEVNHIWNELTQQAPDQRESQEESK